MICSSLKKLPKHNIGESPDISSVGYSVPYVQHNRRINVEQCSLVQKYIYYKFESTRAFEKKTIIFIGQVKLGACNLSKIL